MAEKLFVRFATTQDEKAVFDFYNENEHTFVFQRDPEVWKERIAAGAITIINDESGKIVAASISYPITQQDKNGNEVHQWTEVGSTRVALSGLGLFNTLVSAQVLRAYLLEPPKDRFVLEIVVGNDHSKHVFSKLGATPYDIPESLSEKIRSTITPGTAKDPVEWFQVGAEAIPSMANRIIETQKNNQIVSKETGKEYELDFSHCVLTTMFKDELKALAQENLGDIKKPDYKKPLKAPKP